MKTCTPLKDERGEEKVRDKEGGGIHLVLAQTQIRQVRGMEEESGGGCRVGRCKWKYSLT